MWIVYGIVDARRAASEDLPTGLDGAGLVAIRHGRLAVLLSPRSETAESAGVDQALAYAEVVGQLHRRMTILPMRFGCFVGRPERAAEFLRRHESEFSEALATLEGCDEMGLRILLPGEGEPVSEVGAAEGRPEMPTGTAYLASRRRFYEQQARAERTCRRWVERARAALTGLYRDSSWEFAARPEGILLSVSFLVERSKAPAFMEACRTFRRDHSATSICSGPWPPYVFVAGLAKPEVASQAEREFLQPSKG